MADETISERPQEPLSPKSGHDSWPPLVADSERADPDESLAPASVVTPRGPLPSETPAQAAPSAEESAADEETTSVQAHVRGKPGKPMPPGVQKRINQAVAAQRDAERREQELQARLRELESRLPQAAAPPSGAPQAGQPPAPTPRDPNRPKPQEGEFKTYSDYIDAITDWKTDRAIYAFLQATAQQHQQQQQQSAEAAFAERRNAWIAAHPDFEALVAEHQDMPTSPAMHDFFRHEEDGLAVLDYLVRHPEESARIARLQTSGQQLSAMGRIAARLETPKPSGAAPSRPVLVPRAPVPITPVGASPHRSSDPSDLEFGPEYVRRMNAQERERRRAGLR